MVVLRKGSDHFGAVGRDDFAGCGGDQIDLAEPAPGQGEGDDDDDGPGEGVCQRRGRGFDDFQRCRQELAFEGFALGGRQGGAGGPEGAQYAGVAVQEFAAGGKVGGLHGLVHALKSRFAATF